MKELLLAILAIVLVTALFYLSICAFVQIVYWIGGLYGIRP